MSDDRLAELRDDLSLGLLGGLGIAIKAAPILALWFVGGTIWHLTGRSGAPSWADVFGLPLLVLLGYSLAAIGVGIGLFLLRPLRRWFLGWLLTGYILGVVLYGSVGLIAVLGYQFLGVNLLNTKSVEQGWQMLLPVSAICGVVGLVVGGIWWFQFGRRV